MLAVSALRRRYLEDVLCFLIGPCGVGTCCPQQRPLYLSACSFTPMPRDHIAKDLTCLLEALLLEELK